MKYKYKGKSTRKEDRSKELLEDQKHFGLVLEYVQRSKKSGRFKAEGLPTATAEDKADGEAEAGDDEGDDLEIDDSFLFLQSHLAVEDSSSLVARELKMKMMREEEEKGKKDDDDLRVVYRRS